MLLHGGLVLSFLLCCFSVTAIPHRGSKKGKANASKGLGVAISNPLAKDKIANKWIVVYNSNLDDNAVLTHQASVMSTIATRNVGKRSLDGRILSTKVETVKMGAWRAMCFEADEDLTNSILAAPEVAYVEQDAKVKASDLTIQSNPPSGLARISNSASSLAHSANGIAQGKNYVFDSTAGAGITVYVVDTGIRTTHSDFEGRAVIAANFVNNVNTDENGHGTHVTGTIGGKTFGVSKKVALMGVKVLDTKGEGTSWRIIAGLNFVAQNASAIKGKAVMNMSLGGSRSTAVNAAINALAKAGVIPVVAAGNEAQDSVNTSPASSRAAITVGAIDQTTNARAIFSNFGKVVDIYAPGVNILSAGFKSDHATQVLSGTSMSCPHVAGLAAYLMSLEGITDMAAVLDRIKSLATASGEKVKKNVQGTTSLIANNGAEAAETGNENN